ncbi:MAG: ribonuclease H-like domain-containing protein [Lachnospiraceae bacterium]|nr:ribonuclease H-like domain-containing protein [Lachnospiraceae bacterium]
MKIIDETLEPFEVSYPAQRLGDPEKLLFVDIETTGFTAHSSNLYLIGTAFYREGHWCTRQWFAENFEEEPELLKAFFAFAHDFDTLVHYNGNQFDLPYLTQKCKQYDIEETFDAFQGVDLYRRINTCRHVLKLSNCKQKTLELFLGIGRTDTFTGGDLIGIYRDYVNDPTDFAYDTLLLHNEDDLKGMLQILPMLSYYDLFFGEVIARRAELVTYRDYSGQQRKEILITIQPPTKIPVEFSASTSGCYLHASPEKTELRVPLTTEEMKYFYADYKEYYYLPDEDLALHKSVATFVDKDHRVQATAANCYTRKVSDYLPQWDYLFSPIFRKDYHSREMYFELTEDFKRNKAGFSDYASHVLTHILESY